MTPEEYLKSLSDEELSNLDSQGIKILGIGFDIDFNDRSWAE